MDTTPDSPAIHPLHWDDAMVARFWDFISQVPAQQGDYFSQRVGGGISLLLQRLGLLQGRVLDYGCGPGFLLEHLLATGAVCEGFDFSPETVATVNRRFAGHKHWKGALCSSGARLPYDDDTFDLVVCLETIEHVLPHRLDPFLSELRRILKPGTGRLFLTTPWEEDLDRVQILCPSCGSVFHRYQHVRSFTIASLQALMTSQGYVTDCCERTMFERFAYPLWPGFADLTPRRVARLLWSAGCRALDQLAPAGRGQSRWVAQFYNEGRNLFWFGGKVNGSTGSSPTPSSAPPKG